VKDFQKQILGWDLAFISSF